MRLKRIDITFIILLVSITFFTMLFTIIPELRELIENISKYPVFQNLLTALLVTFWVCLIGNLIPFPTPYPFVICFSSAPFLQMSFFIPLLVGFIASLGCLIGELGGYQESAFTP